MTGSQFEYGSMVGKQFGDLIVIAQEESNHRGNRMWLCECKCGERRSFPTSYLTSGRNTHCGCKADKFTREVTCENCLKIFIPGKIKYCKDGILRCKECSAINTHLCGDYGITLTEFNDILKQQGGVCKICKNPNSGYNGSRLYVDHDHDQIGKESVRGLLCRSCNLLLGYMKDDATIARSAISYLEESNITINRDWDKRFLNLAQLVSAWSKDPSTQVGAVIAQNNKHIVSVGFNGFPAGMEDKPEWFNNREVKYSRIIHAESNALLFAPTPLPEACSLYTFPMLSCDRCIVHMLQAGIRRFVAPKATSEKEERWGEAFKLTRQYIHELGGYLVEVEV